MPPSIAIAECENASVGGEKDHIMGFLMVDIMTHKYLEKFNLFIRESALENAIAFSKRH